jgi:hypothetical protein
VFAAKTIGFEISECCQPASTKYQALVAKMLLKTLLCKLLYQHALFGFDGNRAVVVVESCTGFKDERDLLRGVI